MAFPCLLAVPVAALVGWLLTSQLGRLGFLDQPNVRSSHKTATPRGGGLSFQAAVLLLLPWLAEASHRPADWLLLIPLPLAFVGLVDDYRGLPARLRLLVQLATGLALALAAGFSLSAACAAAVLTAALINAVNFMDGLDGLVGSCLMGWLALAALLLQQPALLLLAAALFGFLLCNWSPARLFMGDVGSTYLGAVLAGTLLLASRQPLHQISLGLWLAALPLLADAVWCLWRRWRAGQRLWQAHRLHLYQRLQQAGWSHAHVALLYAISTALLAAVALGFQALPLGSAIATTAIAAGFTLAVGWWLDRRVAVPFAVPPSH
jgi:Fuc2NAc and GlcNAc transferase